MKFDYSKLRGKIVEKYGTLKAFATAQGINVSHLVGVLNSGRSFKTETVWKIADALGVLGDIDSYFFTPAVRKTEQIDRSIRA